MVQISTKSLIGLRVPRRGFPPYNQHSFRSDDQEIGRRAQHLGNVKGAKCKEIGRNIPGYSWGIYRTPSISSEPEKDLGNCTPKTKVSAVPLQVIYPHTLFERTSRTMTAGGLMRHAFIHNPDDPHRKCWTWLKERSSSTHTGRVIDNVRNRHQGKISILNPAPHHSFIP